MKKLIVSTLVLSSALAIGACNKDKKPAAADPAATPAMAEPAKTDPAAAAPAMPEAPKKEEAKPASGGW